MKLNSGKTVQTLNSLKKKLTEATERQRGIAVEIEAKKAKQSKTLLEINTVNESLVDAKKF